MIVSASKCRPNEVEEAVAAALSGKLRTRRSEADRDCHRMYNLRTRVRDHGRGRTVPALTGVPKSGVPSAFQLNG